MMGPFARVLITALSMVLAAAANARGASAAHPVRLSVTIPYQHDWRDRVMALETDVHVDYLTLQYHTRDGRTGSVLGGMLVPVAERAVRRAVPTLIIPRNIAPAPLQVTLVSEVDHPNLRVAPIAQLWREDAVRRGTLDFPLLIFIGIFLALALGNLTFFTSLRDTAYVAYAGVMLSAAFIAMRTSPDLLWTWMFPHLSVPFIVVYDASILTYSFCLVTFTRSFLSTPRLLPRIDRLIVGMFALFVVVQLISHYGFTSVHFGGIELVDVVYIVFTPIPLLAGVLTLRAGYPTALYYVIAFCGVFGALIVMNALAFLGHWYMLLIFFGITWEGIWLIAALGDRVRRLDRAALDLAQEQAAAALHDSLTSLPNRRQLEMDLREIGPPFSLIYLDLDHFSVINSTAGHEAGDALLIRIAQRLERFVGPREILARTASDEFALVLRDASRAQGIAISQEIVEAIGSEPFMRDHQTFRVAASVGCVYVERRLPPSTLLAIADNASACAKEQGRNRVYATTDTEAAQETTQSAMRWARRISDALEENRLALFYQPIVQLHRNGEPPHIEILVRLIDEDGTIVETSEFLPPAERFSLAASIDRWVIRQALPVLKPLIDTKTIGQASINLSGNALQDPQLAEDIDAELRRSGIDPSGICFEITETVVLSMLDNVRTLIAALRKRGVCFSLDDFGTGTSSLSVLRQLDVKYLKIDGAFVRDCATNPVDAAMLKTIRDLASALGLQTVAEYAKDAAIIQTLRRMGIDYAQGFAIGKPQPIEVLTHDKAVPFDSIRVSNTTEMATRAATQQIPRRPA